ncbi:hypothetical protein ACLOJK_040833 [Asimina triloba]
MADGDATVAATGDEGDVDRPPSRHSPAAAAPLPSFAVDHHPSRCMAAVPTRMVEHHSRCSDGAHSTRVPARV